MRSMTLIPVSNISSLVLCSSSGGGSRWMEYFFAASTGPIWSTGPPMTLSTRPSVPSPTGTSMGPSRSKAVMPRARPSVGCMATQRTLSSPMCCSTSTIMSIGVGVSKPSLVIRTAL